MKKAFFVIGIVVFVCLCLSSCKQECFCDSYRRETGNVVNNIDVGPATKQECADLQTVKTVQIYNGTFHDSLVCHQ